MEEPSLQVGSRVKIVDETGRFTQTELFDSLVERAMPEKPLPWADARVAITTNKTQGNLMGVFAHPIRPQGPRVALVALDNRQGLIVIEADALRPITWIGAEVRVVPMHTEAMATWRRGAEAAFKGLTGYVPALDADGEMGTIEEVLPNPAFPGQFVMRVRLLEDDPGLFQYSVWSIDSTSGELIDTSETAESPMALYTLLHGFEAPQRRPGDTSGKRRRDAQDQLAQAPPRMQPGLNVQLRSFRQNSDPSPLPTTTTGTSNQVNEDSDGTAAALTRTTPPPPPDADARRPVYVAKGYGAQAFNEAVAADPTYVDQMLQEAPPPPNTGLYQSRVVRPSSWVWLM